ncbi:unnamed protein product [Pleuronectes platessa]|uniref:Uncharacterized protein n=1 Tax=Pleuronectes platessa TaxID=8262 RepID=A0A9N7ZBH8_PLEPL|nr:unnamed protein product [Pleuronectes platessa]
MTDVAEAVKEERFLHQPSRKTFSGMTSGGSLERNIPAGERHVADKAQVPEHKHCRAVPSIVVLRSVVLKATSSRPDNGTELLTESTGLGRDPELAGKDVGVCEGEGEGVLDEECGGIGGVSSFMAVEQRGVSLGAEAAACSRGPVPGSPYPIQLGFVIGSPELKDTVHHLTRLNACKMSNQHCVWSLRPQCQATFLQAAAARPRRPRQ